MNRAVFRFVDAYNRHTDGERLYVFARRLRGDSRSEVVTVPARQFWQGAEPRAVGRG